MGMKLLILCQDYPNLNGGKSLAFAHTRNIYYTEHGIDVDVINFSTENDYVIDDVKVFCDKNFQNDISTYDVVVCHAANIKNHLGYLKRNIHSIKKIVFFFHGHEVLKLNHTYPVPYDFEKKRSILNKTIQEIYDVAKLKLWKVFFSKYYNKCEFVFVSKWMKKMFLKNIHETRNIKKIPHNIIYNCVGEDFAKQIYNMKNKKKYDFVTIRGNIDGSKYCINLINEIARRNGNCSFLVIGQGEYFEHYEKADNVIYMNKVLSHQEMISYCNESKFALMPTKLDAQGVAMCELATLGIPLITSSLDVCHEVLDDFQNAIFFDNERMVDVDFESLVINYRLKNHEKNKKFFYENTINKELSLFDKIKGEK